MTKTTKILLFTLGAALLFGIGRLSKQGSASTPGGAQAPAQEGQRAAGEPQGPGLGEPETWTCPMHPQIKLPDPGDCPICGMDLVLLQSRGEEHPRQLAMSPESVALARVSSQPVRRRNVTRPVRMVGKIDYDETAVRTISAWVAGRLERLYVDYTGVSVKAGEHLVKLYSPDLSTAQEELLAARERLEATEGEESEFLAQSNLRAYESAREKLLLWGLTEAQVDEIEARGSADDYMTLTSPFSGVVIDKWLDEGAYVKTGTPIYRIADLGQLWVQLDAYEQDLPWLRIGQLVTMEVEALPGKRFEGRISFIDPVIEESTRTAKVRINLDNERGRLKPGMFTRAVASARIGAGGVVLDTHLAGKWVCPMHSESVADGPAVCDICGMDLKPAEELGLVDPQPIGKERPVVVPKSAVLITGKRAVVYVELPGREEPTYEGREIVLGPRAGDEYVVLAGLEAGERVVTNGAFRIDSSMQIQAKPSMMDMPGEGRSLSGPEGLEFLSSLEPLYAAYLELQAALAQDEVERAREALASMAEAVSAPSAAGLPEAHRALWSEEVASIEAALDAGRQSDGLEGLRAAFERLSDSVLELLREFGHSSDGSLHEVHCPMAFDGRGASWVQAGDEIHNPYFGSAMPHCGSLSESFEPIEQGEQAQAGMSMQGAGHDHSKVEHRGAPGEDAASAESAPVELSRAARASLRMLFEAYLGLQQALAEDDLEEARSQRETLGTVLGAVEGSGTYSGDARQSLTSLSEALASAKPEDELDAERSIFHELSESMLGLASALGNPLTEGLRVVHCPMAFDFEGADWLQLGDEIHNPYFGSEMPHCGSVQRVLKGK